jgi:tetratricopeptide (TPR) repeat protein
MATNKAPARVSRRHELREDQVITFYSRLAIFFEDNRTLVFGVIGAVVLLVILGAGYSLFQEKKEDQAQTALAAAVRAYERGDYQLALDGEESGAAGLLEVAREYGGTDAGNLATFYAGDALYRQGKFAEALPLFEDFDKGDSVLGAAAYAAEAAIYENTGDYARAAERYERAASGFATDFTTPQYLLNAGRNYASAGNFAKARTMYERIESEYPESAPAREIEYYTARLDALAASK